MNEVFLDTGYLLALELSNDQYHALATQHWQNAIQSLPVLVTTSYVFNEVVTYYSSRGLHDKAVAIGSMLLHSASVRLIHVDESLLYEGWTYFQQHKDKTYSLTDCISFVIMARRGIASAYALDRHFVQAGFRIEPALR